MSQHLLLTNLYICSFAPGNQFLCTASFSTYCITLQTQHDTTEILFPNLDCTLYKVLMCILHMHSFLLGIQIALFIKSCASYICPHFNLEYFQSCRCLLHSCCREEFSIAMLDLCATFVKYSKCPPSKYHLHKKKYA